MWIRQSNVWWHTWTHRFFLQRYLREDLPFSHKWWGVWFFHFSPEVFQNTALVSFCHVFHDLRSPEMMWMFTLASRERHKTNLLKLLSSRQHIRPLLDCRFLQNAAGSFLPAKMNHYVANVISFQGMWVQTGWCVSESLTVSPAPLC